MKTIGIINGPNMNRLGKREPHLYGDQTLDDLEKTLKAEATVLGVEVIFFQANSEGALVDIVDEWEAKDVMGVVINPAAYTHTSVALRDAMSGSSISFVEVHISNLYGREPFRQQSLTASACMGMISGLGFEGYLAGLRYLVKNLE